MIILSILLISCLCLMWLNSIHTMKHLIFSVAFLCFSIMSFCADKDSLVLVTQRLHEAFNLKDDGLYKISVDRKFIGDTDTSQNISVVKFYPSLSGSKLDAIKNHFHHHTDMDYGTLYNQGQLVVANYEKKRVWTIEDYTQKMLKIIHKRCCAKFKVVSLFIPLNSQLIITMRPCCWITIALHITSPMIRSGLKEI